MSLWPVNSACFVCTIKGTSFFPNFGNLQAVPGVGAGLCLPVKCLHQDFVLLDIR